MGNDAFRNGDYERACSMYTKAVDHIKDSPVLYNNRALTYIRYSKRHLFFNAIILKSLRNFFSVLMMAKKNTHKHTQIGPI